MKFKTTSALLLILTIFMLPTGLIAQDYYWSNNKKIPLIKDDKAFLIRANEKSKTESNLTREVSIESLMRVNQKSLLVKLKSSERSVLEELSAISDNRIASFKTELGYEAIPTGEILFKPKEGITFDKINELSGEQLSIAKEKYGTFRVYVTDYRELLNLSNKIYESGLVEYCQPDFIMEVEKFQNDPLYTDQYYLNNTGQLGGTAGIDINAPQAWGISTGLHNVRVAVLDDGVENHEDINGRVVAGFTAAGAGNGAPGAGSAHGQACAGIIAASHNNLGIAGVAPCADIIPIRILGVNASVGQIAAAIDWAWDDGNADVLSNSWGFTDPNAYHDAVEDAIARARTQGRGGDGSIVVAASGNSQQTFNGVLHPANVPGVVTVGAIDNNGNIWNYSSRGAEMDLVAPSGDINLNGDVRTTDRMGNNGYVPGNPGLNNNYVNVFGGTSAACPQVSGVAALMLSVNPTLTEAQIVAKLKGTATDMGSSGFDNTFGNGRLNA